MKTIGVIVPIYNAEKYLVQCVDSIRLQTFQNLEIILVDDGSTDNSGELCDYYASIDSRIKVVHQENKGMIGARYAGVCRATSEYITFVDSDDWIDKNAYTSLEKYLKNEIDVVLFGSYLYYEEEPVSVLILRYQSGFYDKTKIRTKIHPTMIWKEETKGLGLTPALWNKLIKRHLVLEALENAIVLAKEKIDYGEDMVVSFPIMTKIDTLQIVDECFYYYRQRPKGDIPKYLIDPKFYKKMYLLYEYLVEQIGDKEDFLKQLDHYYAYIIKKHLLKYNNNIEVNTNKYLFPFQLIPAHKKLVLYGAGVVGQSYMIQLKRLNYCESIVWVDKNANKYKELDVLEIDYINEIKNSFDYIVIAIKKKEIADTIRKEMISKYKIEEEKIIWYIVE